MTAAPAIEVSGLRKTFGSVAVLRGIDFTVGAGELIGLVGKNGAGKSTLLRTLVGLCPRTSGDVRVLGLDPASEDLAIRRRAAYLPGETSVYHNMTGREFLAFARSFYPRHQDDLERDLIDRFALPLQQRVRSYSAGMKQKLALLATLVPDLDLYLLDEPDRALDASVRFQLREVLLRLRRAGKTIVLSSHHLSEVESLADRLEFLLDGRIVASTVVSGARTQLCRQVRLRLANAIDLPAGARTLQRDPDGTLVLAVDGDPIAWLARLPAGSALSAEVGVTRLEDLYQLLLEGAATDAGDAE